MQWVETTKKILGKGIYVSSLREIVHAASIGLKSGSMVLPAFVIGQIAQSVHDSLDGRVVQLPESRAVAKRLLPAFEALLDALLRNAPKTEINDLLEGLIGAWQLLQAELEEIADLDK